MFNIFRLPQLRQLSIEMNLPNVNFSNLVEKALERLPDDLKYERIYRIRIAMELQMKQRILPEDEWTKPHEDVR